MTIRAVCWPVATQTSIGRPTRISEKKPAKKASPAPVVSFTRCDWSFSVGNSQDCDRVAQTAPAAPQVTMANLSLSLDQSQASVDPANEILPTSIRKEKKYEKKRKNTLKIRETTRFQLIHRWDIFQSGDFAGDRVYGFGTNQKASAVGQGTEFVFVTDDKIGVR